LYIINFNPHRRPLGDPYDLDGPHPPTLEQITESTFVTFPDDDAGPAKAWLVSQRNNPQWKPLFDATYGLRPREELYDLKTDPHQMYNVAQDPAFATQRADLERRLLDELRNTNDPRLIDDGKFYETPPMSGPSDETRRTLKNRKNKS
ncbi:MAG: sulfatase, partial [Planctomycetaceae bacterium]|nr:sulfatase [Planctomycetaceae bacterium]